MPTRRSAAKRAKLDQKRYLKSLQRKVRLTQRRPVALGNSFRWSEDFVLRDGSQPLSRVIASLPATKPEFVVLTNSVLAGKEYLAVRPAELMHALAISIVRQRGGPDRDKRGPGGRPLSFEPREREKCDAPACRTLEQLSSGYGSRRHAPWMTRSVVTDIAGAPRAVGERLKGIEARGARKREWLRLTSDFLSPDRVLRVVDVDLSYPGAHGPPSGTRTSAPNATDPPPPTPPTTAPPPGETGEELGLDGTSIIRHPSLKARSHARPGLDLLLDVDLLRFATDAQTESTGFQIEGLPDDWDLLPIQVQVACEHLHFEAGKDHGTVLVRRDQESIACTLAGRVAAECDVDRLEVLVTFTHRARFCCLASIRVPVEGRDSAEHEESLANEPAGEVCRIYPSAEGAALTVYIRQLESRRGTKLLWVLTPGDTEVQGLPARLDEVVHLPVQPRTFVKHLLDQAGSRRRGMHAPMLEALGQLLYEQAPKCFQDAYWALRRAHAAKPDFPIQFICEEPHIPWEMMYPYDPDTEETAGFLFEEHPVVRWLGDYRGWLTPRFRKGQVLSITPDYDNAPKKGRNAVKPLPWAQKEATFLRQQVGAVSVRPTWKEVIDLLKHGSKEAVTVLHFAGHGSYNYYQPDRSQIFLEDYDLTALEVRNKKHLLGRTHRPLVIFNACEVGASGKVLDKVAGWANAFLYTRFGGFIAPLWSVYDDDAAELVSQLVERIMTEDAPVSVALQKLRREHAASSPTFLAYLYYGDVMARVRP